MHVSDLDELLGAPARLAVLATLADGERWTFRALRDETGLADGNLHVQTGKLVEAGYVSSAKVQQGNRTVTSFELTPVGRRALREHVQRLEQLVGQRRRRQRRMDDEQDGSRVW